jgi:acyl carrier protein
MRAVSVEAVRDLLLLHLEEPLAALGLKPSDVPDDFDLLTEGVIDSLGIVQMIAALDAHFGVAIDLEHLDPEQLTVIGPLCRYVAAWISNNPRRNA